MSRVKAFTTLSSNEWRTGYRHLDTTGPSCSYHFIRRSMSRLVRLVGGSVAQSMGGWPEPPQRGLVQLQAYDSLSLTPQRISFQKKGKETIKKHACYSQVQMWATAWKSHSRAAWRSDPGYEHSGGQALMWGQLAPSLLSSQEQFLYFLYKDFLLQFDSTLKNKVI